MMWRLRLVAAFVFALAVPLGVALLVVDAPISDELIVFGLTVLLGIAVAIALSRSLIRPFRTLTQAAERLAAEDPATAPLDEEELGELASAFNRLRERMLEQRANVAATHGEIRESVRRLGEALRSTHDIRQMLSVVLETALVAVQGRSGAVFLLSARRSELYVKIGRHIEPSVAERRIPVGQGLVGWVAEQRTAARIPGSDAPPPVDPEPIAPTALAVPLESQSQLLGVLAVYGRTVPAAFDADDLDVITSLARQAGVGIENVLLHQEAQRLSITDGLTGVWNRRFYQMRVTQEFERASRFDRPFSLLMIDIDHFKSLNDRYGHQRGDSVLIELAQRIVSHTRLQVDTLARYGGEEFVLILPETAAEGARIVAEKIRAEIAGVPFGSGDEQAINVSVSIGYAMYPHHGATAEALQHAADRAMYLAKSRGRNTVVGADELGEDLTLAPDGVRP